MKTKTIITAFLLLFSITTFSQNKEHKEYYKSGRLHSIGYKTADGKMTGEWKEYYVTGELMSVLNYNNDQLQGKAKDYHKNGKLKFEGNYINGALEGEVKYYFENGNLAAVENYKNGNYDGQRKSYYESGSLKFMENWSNDEKIGRTTYYFENGQEDKRPGDLETALNQYLTTNIEDFSIDKINVRTCDMQIFYTDRDNNSEKYISMPHNLNEIDSKGKFKFKENVVKFHEKINDNYISVMEATYLDLFYVKKEGSKIIQELMKNLAESCE